MNIDDYLQRIDYRDTRAPTAATLQQLHRAHLWTVPFENLSISWGEPIDLDEAALFDKIVRRRRGGFCYELNGLFAALLRELGFSVTMLSAGVMAPDGNFGPEFDHLTLLVELQQRYLVDVGFGDSFRQPLRLDDTGTQQQDGHAYRIVVQEPYRVLEWQSASGVWNQEYRFTLQPHPLAAFMDMCHYHQTSPASPFTNKRLCTRATPDGRITLSEMRWIRTWLCGRRDERTVDSVREYAEILQHYFGVAVTDQLGPAQPDTEPGTGPG